LCVGSSPSRDPSSLKDVLLGLDPGRDLLWAY